MAKNNEEKKKESPTKWAESTKDGVAKGIRIYGDVRVSDEDTRDRKVFKNYSSTAGASSPASGIQARNQRNRLGIGLSRFNPLAGASSFEEYAKMRRQQEEAEGMRSAADKLGGMFTAHQKAFSPNDSRTAKILPAEQEAMDRAAERGARIASGESTYEQEMKAAQAEREAKADPVTVQTPQQAAAEALMRNYGYKTIGNQTVFVTPFSPLPTPTKENTATKASAPFAFDIDPDQYVKDMMAIDRGMGFQAGAKNYQLDPNDPFADLKRREQVAASGAMMEPTIDAETQKILDTYFGGKLPSMDEFNAKYEELYDDARLTDEEVAYFYHRGSELVGNALNAMEQGPPVLDEETQSFLNKYFGGQIPTADEFNEKYEQIYDGTGVGDEYVKAFEEGAESVEKAIRDAQAYGSAYGDAMIEYGQALGRLGYDAKDYAGLNSEAGYYSRYGLDYDRANVAQAYEDQYRMPGIMGSYDEHDATMQMIKSRGMDTPYSGTDLETGRTLLQSEMDDETAQTYMYLASEYGEEAAQNYIDAMLKGEYNPRAWEIRDKALRAGANENWAKASLRSFASVPGQVAGTAYVIEQALKGEEIDPYDTDFMPAQLTQTPRDEVSQMITRNYGKLDENGQPVNNAQSYILNALYQAAMSSGDSTLAMLVSGGPHGGMAAAMQGLWAWGSGAQDATMRGGNSAQAALLGGVQGLVEMATEYVPMEQLAKAFERESVKEIKDILLMALHGAISEAPGEGLSELGGALADKAIMDELSNWDAAVNEKGVGGAAAQLAGDVLTSMLVGALSGAGTNTTAASLNYGVGKAVDAYQQHRTNKLLEQAAQDLNEVQKQEQSAAQQPAEIPDELATGLEGEYAGVAEEVAENAPVAAEVAQGEAEQVQPEAEQEAEEKPAETPEKAENKDRFKAKKSATLISDGESSAVDVVGVDSVSDTGLIMLEVEDQNGKRSVVNAADVSFDDDVSEELMGYAASERMDAKGLRSYMEGYDSSIATPEQYAEAYSSVYSRGRAGVDYDNAALNNSEARQYLSNDAMIAAYAAGENAYNQTHDTVQPAALETTSGNAAAPANAKLSVKDGVKTTRTRGRVSRQYSQAAFSKLGKEGRRNAMSQMELLGALASRTGHTIRVVDSLAGKDGKKANAMYDPRTREITVALDATGGAYAYAAAHELTHALRNEHKSEWNGFRDFVRGALERNGQVWEDLVKYQQDRFGYNREDAEEEVICNTVPALLKDERNLFELYKGNRTLFDRVVNWVKGLLEDVKNAGQALSSRSKSWEQMDALANDRKALQDIYDMMMRIMEKEAEESYVSEAIGKMSSKDVQALYEGVDLSKDSHVYEYDFLVRLPAIKISTEVAMGRTLDANGKIDHEALKKESLANAAKLGKIENGNVLIENRYTGRVMRISGHSVDHSTHTDNLTKNKINARAGLIAGELARNAVPLNAEYDTASNVQGTYVMAAPMRSANGKIESVAALTMEIRSGELKNIETFDMLHAVSVRKKNAGALDAQSASAALTNREDSTAATRSEYSIAEFLNIVKETHQSMLSEDVLKHFGLERNPAGYYSGRVKFSQMDSEGNELTEEQQEYFAESKVRDDEGKLLVMYHGTTAYGDINVFKPGKKGWLGPGIYLTNKKSDAQHYADAMGPGNGKLYTMYANVKSPLYVYGSDPVPEIMRAAYGNDRAYNARAAKQANSPSMLTKADITKLKGKGYDGIVWKFYKSVEVSVFGPEQIKNIDNKAPTDNNDIRYSMQDSEDDDQTETEQFKRWFGKSQVVNDDGSPKVMYRGGGEEINVFDRKKSKASNLYGRGFYFTDSETHAKQYGEARSYYLRIVNPLNAGSGEKKITPKQMRAFLEAVAEDEDYGLENYGYGATVDSVLKSLKGTNDFDALQDINATAIGDFVAAIELFNEVNGTNYDGIITPTETVVFDSRQIKSATNNVGTFDPENPDIRYSMQDIDDEYMAAVRKNDKAKMREMLDAAAKKHGFVGGYYHGTQAFGFTEFDLDKMDDGMSIFVTDDLQMAKTYSGDRGVRGIREKDNLGIGNYQLYVKPGETMHFDAQGMPWHQIPITGEHIYDFVQYTYIPWMGGEAWVNKLDGELLEDVYEIEDAVLMANTREIAFRALEEGYDSVQIDNVYDSGGLFDEKEGDVERPANIRILFRPSDVKSADLITYDAKGNVIPLSERFRDDTNDIRYSLVESDENVRDAAKSAQGAFGMIRGHYINAAEADKLAGSLLKKSNSDYDRQRLASEISRTIDYIERGEDVDIMQVFDELTSMGARVMEKSKTLDLDHEERMKPIRDYLKNTKIHMTEKQRAEAESAAGSYGAYRKSMFGRVRLVSAGGVPLDSAWQELSQMDPELFPADAREGDMPALLQAAVDASKPVYHDGTGMTTEEGANWVALQLIDEYLKLPAVKAAVKNAKTFGESLTDLNKAVKRYKDSSWSEYQNALRAINEARDAKTKSEKQKELAAMRKKYKEWRDKDAAQRRERELKRRYRARIEATVKQLTDWIAKPTDAKHIPAGLEDTIRRMLESLDFSGKDTKTAKLLSERLSNLADVLQRAQESGEENQSIFLERDQQMIDEIRRVAELIRGNTEFQGMEGRGIYDLNGLELKELSKWLDVIKHNVIEASKLRGSELPYESVDEAAQLSMMELSGKKPLKDKKWIPEKWYEFFGPDMWDSFSFFERLGATANEIFKGLRRGFDKMTQLTREAEEFTKKLLDGVDLKRTTGKKAEKIQYTTTHGETMELTRGNIMEIYVLSRREQATGHMYGGGILIANSKDAMPKVLTKVDVAKLTSMLSKDELRIADGLQRFLSKEAAAWGNATSRKLVGYNKFGEEFYWPINTDPNTRMTTKLEDNYAADINAIKNQGMTKATVQGASNAIVIGDIFDTYVRHISNMAAYASYAIPLSDFTRWYNARGVKTQIDHIMGKKGLEYINNFLMAVNGSGLRIDQSGLSRLSAKLTRNAKIASVGANLRVVIQQPTSYARAALMISPKYLTAALTMKAPKKGLIDKYCGIAQWKHWGFYETNIGPSLRGVIVNDAGAMEKARGWATWMASKGDEWTLNRLWNACALEAADCGYVKGSEGYYTYIGERMSEIIDRTQVVDSVFHRSQIMRSKNPLNQMLTNFMSEPNKTFNMLMSAIEEYASNRKNKAAKIKLARTLATYAVTGVMTAAAAAVIDAFRDEDDEKEWLEKYGSALMGNVGDNLNPLGLLPGVKDVLSFIQGYSNSAGRMDTQSIQKIIWAADEIRKAINGESKMSVWGVSYKVSQALSSLFGLPVSNVIREVNAIAQTITGRTITKNAEGRRSQTAGLLYDAMMGESKRDAKKLREELSGRAGMNPKEIDEQLAIRLAEEPEIAQAYEAKVKRDYATMNRIRNSFTARGFGGETFDRALEKYRNSYIKEKASEIAEDDLVIEAYNAKQAGQDATVEQKTKALMDRGYTQEAISEAISMYGKTQKDMEAQLESTLFTTDEAAGAIRVLAGLEKGTVTESDLKLMISERVAASSAEDPEASAKSSIVSALKGTYLDLDAKGDTAGMKRLAKVMKDQLGTEQAKLDSWVSDKRGDDLRAAVDAYDVGAAGKVVQKLRKEGSADSDIKARLKTYKEKYLEAVNRKDTVTANKIKRTLIGLGLLSKKGEPLYSEETFAEWIKTK